MAELRIEHHLAPEDDRVVVVHLLGSLDIASVDRLTGTFDQLISEGLRWVVVDFDGVEFISSPAVGALMGCRRRLIEVRGNLVFTGLQAGMREKLNLMGANRIFRYFPDVRTAVTEYRWEYDANPQRLTLQMPANSGYVPAIRRMIASVVQQKGYGRKDSFRIETIVDELCNNAIEHGDHGQSKFFIDFFLDRDKVEVVVRNSNKDMDAPTIERIREKFHNPVVDDESIRGRGLALVKMLSTELRLQIDSDGTLVHVTKKREE